jgi:antitoxin component of MazEF toxin-antitoxin module
MQGSSRKQKIKKPSPRATSKGNRRKTAYEQPHEDNPVSEPAVEYTAKIRAIGNSRGIILNGNLIDTAGLDADRDIVIQAVKGLITVKQAEKPVVNKDLSTWDKQFKAAIKGGAKPESDLFDGIENEFDAKEW